MERAGGDHRSKRSHFPPSLVAARSPVLVLGKEEKMPVSPEVASNMIDRLESAAVEYERAPASRVAAARQEKADARRALFEALTREVRDAA